MPGSDTSDEFNDDGDAFIVDVDSIQAHGIGAADITKLKANGFYTVTSVHGATRKTLLKIKGFSEVKVEKIKEAVNKCLVYNDILIYFHGAMPPAEESGSNLDREQAIRLYLGRGFPKHEYQ
ncbi:hypothetical protein EYZ11_001800 [Aspergillus tanneri]|uniref:DNA recombination and repair protein Rad51-like C-terminal domain-containing protein n=1 Tax=Aspergillus tanneri TaxID=1220188 RepID=A0A4S3JTS1_9EURO|nr:hypothetical protein EYZ11_001800 [Aspergillus tanneri]